ncbi:hypothetical protein RQP53_16330 [Paucibacter sp. APW11]|uniref:Uncharacterized protein n=1 Tax=Roseateles aquae TaxID=3077235 RepID=A0ABU3PE49_9BURK|nr:hypothetical protein [Paucibacter sp. APW11]MDT9000844.1 hypothetical protein [Paucibacter sp. APW11]
MFIVLVLAATIGETGPGGGEMLRALEDSCLKARCSSLAQRTGDGQRATANKRQTINGDQAQPVGP